MWMGDKVQWTGDRGTEEQRTGTVDSAIKQGIRGTINRGLGIEYR